MYEAQKRYRATENGKQKHREQMREYMIGWRKRRKESEEYNLEEERRKWQEQHRRMRISSWKISLLKINELSN